MKRSLLPYQVGGPDGGGPTGASCGTNPRVAAPTAAMPPSPRPSTEPLLDDERAEPTADRRWGKRATLALAVACSIFGLSIVHATSFSPFRFPLALPSALSPPSPSPLPGPPLPPPRLLPLLLTSPPPPLSHPQRTRAQKRAERMNRVPSPPTLWLDLPRAQAHTPPSPSLSLPPLWPPASHAASAVHEERQWPGSGRHARVLQLGDHTYLNEPPPRGQAAERHNLSVADLAQSIEWFARLHGFSYSLKSVGHGACSVHRQLLPAFRSCVRAAVANASPAADPQPTQPGAVCVYDAKVLVVPSALSRT